MVPPSEFVGMLNGMFVLCVGDGQLGERCSNCTAAQQECTYIKEAKVCLDRPRPRSCAS